MPPYWDNKAFSTPTRYFIFNFLLIDLIFIEIKIIFLMWFEKGEKKFANRQIRTWVDLVKMSMTRNLPSAPLELITADGLLWFWPSQSHVGGQS